MVLFFDFVFGGYYYFFMGDEYVGDIDCFSE